MQSAVVCGAGGFIGSHLVRRLAAQGFYVRGVDIKEPEFSPTAAAEFRILDLRVPEQCEAALDFGGIGPDHVYNLAADMGGMGFIHSAECEIMRNSALVNINMSHAMANSSAKRYFFFIVGVCIPEYDARRATTG